MLASRGVCWLWNRNAKQVLENQIEILSLQIGTYQESLKWCDPLGSHADLICLWKKVINPSARFDFQELKYIP